jgi:1-pyrroline-5-carboxylate dehydrogenase
LVLSTTHPEHLVTFFAGRPAVTPISPTPSRTYAAGSPERASTAAALAEVRGAGYDIACRVGSDEIRTGRTVPVVTPHEHSVQLAQVHYASAPVVEDAIAAASEAARSWARLPWEMRAEPFLRAADMLEFGAWRDRLNAAAMLELSKTSYEADIDASSETVDFIRANIKNMLEMYDVQPGGSADVTNHVQYRPLEGFVFAVTPFNFVSMNNLAFGSALLGNTVVWKPAESASLVAHLSLQLLREAGLPDGVINLVFGDGAEVGTVALTHRDLAAVAFTGSTATFEHIWRTVGQNVATYRNYPRVIGETGGKDFVLAHRSADLDALATALIRGAYEYQGQKCSAASRLYAPRSLDLQTSNHQVHRRATRLPPGQPNSRLSEIYWRTLRDLPARTSPDPSPACHSKFLTPGQGADAEEGHLSPDKGFAVRVNLATKTSSFR